jgi:hypothetical protein
MTINEVEALALSAVAGNGAIPEAIAAVEEWLAKQRAKGTPDAEMWRLTVVL